MMREIQVHSHQDIVAPIALMDGPLTPAHIGHLKTKLVKI